MLLRRLSKHKVTLCMLRIGNFIIENPVFLAPMAGVTDSAFRRICKSFGCGLVYTEMISAKALAFRDKKTASMLAVHPEEKPFAVQIFGSDPGIMGKIAPDALSTGASILDINMGCPAPKIAGNGDGCAIMRTPKLAYDIVRAVTKTATVPVTVKIRKGWDDNSINAVEVAKYAEDAGAAAVCVHPRTREQFYMGKADWEVIADVKRTLSVPVIGNGDIFTPEDALAMRKMTGCDAVMVGRGAQGNPFLFRQICELTETGSVTFRPTRADKINTIITQLEYSIADKGEYIAVREMRKHAAWYLKGEKNSAQVRAAVNTAASKADLLALLHSLL